MPPPLAKDPALMVRADITASVVNDEEKGARATPQVNEVARDGYRFDVGTSAFWAGCDRATTLVAGAPHVGTSDRFSHETCQLSHKRIVPPCGPSQRVVTPKSWEAMPFVSLGGFRTVLAGGQLGLPLWWWVSRTRSSYRSVEIRGTDGPRSHSRATSIRPRPIWNWERRRR